VERAGAQIRKFFSRLRPELDFSLSHGAWTAKVGVGSAPEEQDGVALLVEALNGLESLTKAQPSDRAVGLVIDEFQKVVELGGETVEAQIRAAIQRHKRTGYVFAGVEDADVERDDHKCVPPLQQAGERPLSRPGAQAGF
jgi:hypothetical protein